MDKITKLWLSLSESNRKRIVSFARVFVTSFAVMFAAQLNLGFPETWSAFGALATACLSSAVKEAIDAVVRAAVAGSKVR
jgi:hypothetical protein